MTMHELNHPDDERLSALSGADPEALADASLRAHVDGCPTCARTVHELARLTAALGELPDLVPSRPLQLLPPVPEPRPAVGWVRRAFAPALAVGVVMVVVGAIGLGSGAASSPALTSAGNLRDLAASAGQPVPAAASPGENFGAASGSRAPSVVGPESATATQAPSSSASPAISTPASERAAASRQPAAVSTTGGLAAGEGTSLIVLLGGLLLIGAALTLRFVLVPRAG
jgi:hypothetical protein